MKLPQSRRVQIKNVAYVICYLCLICSIYYVFFTGRPSAITQDEDIQPSDYAISASYSFDYDQDEYLTDVNQTNRTNQNNCETIHLAIVCGKFNSSRDFYVLLKSILFYRTDPIHLHLFVDNISSSILTELFHTWSVPDLNYTLYNLPDYENEVAWIPSQHYSHRYGLMKVVFVSVLAESNKDLTRVVLLDTDMLSLGNINSIWKEFKRMHERSDSAVFGLVDNLSDWYLNGVSRHVWPAMGRGFNTGLIMVDLTRFRSLNWRQLWRQVTEKELVSHLFTMLADQDIFNAVFKEYGNLVYSLPCIFNYQLNDHTKLDKLCPLNRFRVKEPIFVHWNSPNKHNTKNPKAQYYRNWFLTFRNWDAKLLEREVCETSTHIVDPKDNVKQVDEVCRDMRPRPNENLRTFIYYTQFELNEIDEYDVTLVVHLSIDRLRVLDDLALHWPGPISAAIYLSESETNLLLSSIENGDNLARRNNIGYHLAFRDQGFNYPINKLRNVALNNAKTPYVFLSDVDFLPSLNLYTYLKKVIGELAEGYIKENALKRRALIVPAFENLQYKFEFPTSKSMLETQLNLGSVSMFRDQIWPRGHAPTDYAKWRVSTRPYQVDWRPEYEPFIVTGRVDVARFDERFVGFGWNKVEHIMELAAMDYQFLVLPEAFVIHQFHSASYDILKHRESRMYRACIRQLKKSFLAELNMKYPEFFSKVLSATTASTSTLPSVYDDNYRDDDEPNQPANATNKLGL